MKTRITKSLFGESHNSSQIMGTTIIEFRCEKQLRLHRECYGPSQIMIELQTVITIKELGMRKMIPMGN